MRSHWGYGLQSLSHPPTALCCGCRSLKRWGVRVRLPERGRKTNGEETFLFSALTSVPLADRMHCESTSQPGERDVSDHVPLQLLMLLFLGLVLKLSLQNNRMATKFSITLNWSSCQTFGVFYFVGCSSEGTSLPNRVGCTRVENRWLFGDITKTVQVFNSLGKKDCDGCTRANLVCALSCATNFNG